MPVVEARPVVSERELLPALFWSADSASSQGQSRTVDLSRLQLVFLTSASVFSSFNLRVSQVNWPPWLAAALFACAAAVTLMMHRQNPQAVWYEGRAVAESLKTLVWKYSVRADPFMPPPATPNGEALYRLQLGGVLGTFRRSRALQSQAACDITPAMQKLRAAPLEVRRDVYLRERVQSQHDWYTAKARHCDIRGRTAGRIAVVLPLTGMLGAAVKALGDFDFNLLGFFSALAASAAAWAQLRQYRPLAAAYRVAADELELVRTQLTALDPHAPDAEEVWSRLARDAEDAVSREHTTWQARRELRG